MPGILLEFLFWPWLWEGGHARTQRRHVLWFLRHQLNRPMEWQDAAEGEGWRAHHELMRRLSRQLKPTRFLRLCQDGGDTDALLEQLPAASVNHVQTMDSFVRGFSKANVELAEYARRLG